MALGWANERKQAIGPLGIGQRNIFFLGTFQSHEKQFSREDWQWLEFRTQDFPLGNRPAQWMNFFWIEHKFFVGIFLIWEMFFPFTSDAISIHCMANLFLKMPMQIVKSLRYRRRRMNGTIIRRLAVYLCLKGEAEIIAGGASVDGIGQWWQIVKEKNENFPRNGKILGAYRCKQISKDFNYFNIGLTTRENFRIWKVNECGNIVGLQRILNYA